CWDDRRPSDQRPRRAIRQMPLGIVLFLSPFTRFAFIAHGLVIFSPVFLSSTAILLTSYSLLLPRSFFRPTCSGNHRGISCFCLRGWSRPTVTAMSARRKVSELLLMCRTPPSRRLSTILSKLNSALLL